MWVGFGFFHLRGFIPPVGLISSQNWVIMGSCAVKITRENQKRKMLRTSRLLIKASVAEPHISLLHQGHRSSYPNHFGSSSQQSASSSRWSCDISVSALCKKRRCKPARGSRLQHSHPPAETPWSTPWHLFYGGSRLAGDFGMVTPAAGFGDSQPTTRLGFFNAYSWAWTLL